MDLVRPHGGDCRESLPHGSRRVERAVVEHAGISQLDDGLRCRREDRLGADLRDSLTLHGLEHVVTTGDLEHVVEESDSSAGVHIAESIGLSRKDQEGSRTLMPCQARAKRLETALEFVG